MTAFLSHGFEIRRGFLPPQVCELISGYARLKARQDEAGDRDAQVPGAHSVYGDPLTESLEAQLLPDIEHLCSEPLWPTYSYYRVYRRGDHLPPHVDRLACEISVTLCVGYETSDSAYCWPLWLQPARPKVPAGGEPPHSCQLQPGDIVIYRGCDLMHWRDPFEGDWQVQAFLHYVRKDGPFGSLAKYDGRPSLGVPAASRDPEIVRRMQAIDGFLRRGTPTD